MVTNYCKCYHMIPEAGFKCGTCDTALFTIFRYKSHFFHFTAKNRIFCQKSHIFAYLYQNRIFWHKLTHEIG